MERIPEPASIILYICTIPSGSAEFESKLDTTPRLKPCEHMSPATCRGSQLLDKKEVLSSSLVFLRKFEPWGRRWKLSLAKAFEYTYTSGTLYFLWITTARCEQWLEWFSGTDYWPQYRTELTTRPKQNLGSAQIPSIKSLNAWKIPQRGVTGLSGSW